MVEGRSESVFKTRLGARSVTWRDTVEVVAIDGIAGFTTAAVENCPTW